VPADVSSPIPFGEGPGPGTARARVLDAEDAAWEHAADEAERSLSSGKPHHADGGYRLPDVGASAARRNWIPWAVVGSGVFVSAVLVALFGSTPRFQNAPSTDGASAAADSKTAGAVPDPVEPQEPEPVTQVIVEVRVKPDGARVSVGKQTVISPARIAFELPNIEWPLQLQAEAEGYAPKETLLARHMFSAEPEGLLYKMTDSLAQLAEPAPEPEPAPSAQSPVKDKKEADSGRRAKSASKKPEGGPAGQPRADSQPAAAEPETPAAPTESALDRALQCLSRGDNPCVLAALTNARAPRELDLLIETHRAMGNGTEAEKTMTRYLELHPDGRRASQYRRALGVDAPARPLPAPGLAPTPPPAPTEP
jgi:hypothetical protein